MTLRPQRGFTLLEVMIALGILATVLVVLLGLRNRDVQLQAYARDLTQATLLARSLALDPILSSEAEVGYREGDFADAPRFNFTRTTNTYLIDQVLQLDVKVAWVDPAYDVPGDRATHSAGGVERVSLTRFIATPAP